MIENEHHLTSTTLHRCVLEKSGVIHGAFRVIEEAYTHDQIVVGAFPIQVLIILLLIP
jgi:hypothetical protein